MEKMENDLFFFQVLNMANKCKQNLCIKSSDGETTSGEPTTQAL